MRRLWAALLGLGRAHDHYRRVRSSTQKYLRHLWAALPWPGPRRACPGLLQTTTGSPTDTCALACRKKLRSSTQKYLRRPCSALPGAEPRWACQEKYRQVRRNTQKYLRRFWAALLGPGPRRACPGLVQTSTQQYSEVLATPLGRSPVALASPGVPRTSTDYYAVVLRSTCDASGPPSWGSGPAGRAHFIS